MREFSLNNDKDFFIGMQKSIDVPINAPGAVELYNAKVLEEHGVRDWHSPSAAFTAQELQDNNVTIAAPYPQLFHGMRHVFLLTKGKLFTVNTSTWELTEVTTYDGYSSSVMANITQDGVWDFIDFGETYMFFNGTSWVYRTSNEVLKGSTDKTYVVTTPNVTSAAKYKGHVMYGGFNGTVWNTEWEAALRSLMPANLGLPFQLTDIDSTYVWWTSQGGGDLLWLIYPQLAFTGVLDDKYEGGEPYFIRHIMRGDAGFMPIDFKGPILRMVSYAGGVIACGEDGVCVLPYSGELTTFAKKLTGINGLQQRGTVCSSDTDTILIDSQNQLWDIDSSGKITLLDYSQYMEDITGGEVNIFYDKHESDFYICGEERTFILRRGGLSEVGRLVTGVVNYGADRVAVFEETGTAGAENTEFTYTSGIRDAGTRALKTVVQLEVGLESGDTSSITVALDYRYKHNADFVRTAFYPINDEGFATFPVECLEFRYVVRSTDYRTVAVSYVRYTVQFNDARTVRGLQSQITEQ